tara:strand:- start:382 stop:741 length:360 start_codon:yes stop_codon:yes gene_type:complete
MAYDRENIFAKILRGEIPCEIVYEDDHVLAFEDINPQAPVHVLIIPKGAYQNMTEFAGKASAEEKTAFIEAIGNVVNLKKIDKTGYRTIINNGEDSMQEVPHLHVHVLGGRRLGVLLSS